MTAATKTKTAKAAAHQPRDGRCTACRRTGADLRTPCPGYTTAADAWGTVGLKAVVRDKHGEGTTDGRRQPQAVDPLVYHPRAEPKKRKGKR